MTSSDRDPRVSGGMSGLSDSRCSEGGIEELCAGIHVGRPGHHRSEAVRSDKADTAIGWRRDNGADEAP